MWFKKVFYQAVQEEIFFFDVTELSKRYQAAYVPKRGSSQHVVQEEIFFFFADVTGLSKWYQAAYVLERGSSQHVVQKGDIFFEDVIELSKWYQAAYVPERGSSQHVIQKGIFKWFFFFWCPNFCLGRLIQRFST